MRILPLLALAAIVTSAAPVLADGQNDRMRQAGGSGGSRGGSGGVADGPNSGSGDWSGVCNCLCSLTDLFLQTGACTAGPGPGAPTQVVQSPGPYEVPPPPPPEPMKAFVLVGLERVVDGTFLLVPRLEGALDLPMAPRQYFRIGLEHESFLEAVEGAAGRARWDHIPLSTVRAGWVLRPGSWDLALVAGLKLVDLGRGYEAGLDAGAVLRLQFGRLSFEGGGLVIGLANLVGLEPWLRAAWAFGPLQVGLGWKHTQFFDELGAIRYTGPELSLALRP